jgi:hypothetical protein
LNPDAVLSNVDKFPGVAKVFPSFRYICTPGLIELALIYILLVQEFPTEHIVVVPVELLGMFFGSVIGVPLLNLAGNTCTAIVEIGCDCSPTV